MAWLTPTLHHTGKAASINDPEQPNFLTIDFSPMQDNGDHPIAPDMVLRRHIRPALKRLGINKRIGWHSFRHGLGTMLRQQGIDLKTAQELLRHANTRTTMELYQQSISSEKRAANAIAVRGLLGDSVLQHPSAPSEEV